MAKKLEKQLSFLETTHSYYYAGKEMLSVTRILELAGLSDYSKVPANLLERAQTFGRYLHKACELLDLKRLDAGTLDPGLAPYLDGWKSFVESEVDHFILIERQVVDPKLGYAGTLDRLALMKDLSIALIEIKSSDSLHPAAALQTAAYKKAFDKERIRTVEKRFAIQPRSDGTYDKTEYKNLSEDYADFLACLRVANRKLRDKIK